ncbi:unnamed protein product [Arabidopsis lyrata]|nr:unnamed protein product [Arabidopsis lyrata]
MAGFAIGAPLPRVIRFLAVCFFLFIVFVSGAVSPVACSVGSAASSLS